MRVLKDWRCTVYTCNAGRLSNKMPVLAHDEQKLKLGVIHISEAGIGPEKPMGLSGYTPLPLERPGANRGSVMYVRNDIYPRCLRIFDQDKDEELSGAEIIQIQLDTIPATSIFGLYMETGKLKDEKEHAHKMLQKRVDKCSILWACSFSSFFFLSPCIGRIYLSLVLCPLGVGLFPPLLVPHLYFGQRFSWFFGRYHL